MTRAQESADKKSKLHAALNVMLIIIFIFLSIAMSLIFFKMNHPQSETFFGYKPLIIEDDSMEPAVMPGALVIVKDTDFADIYADELDGDIITFRRPDGQLYTRRAILRSDAAITTKGDHCEAQDSESVTQYTYEHKVVCIMNWTARLRTFAGIAIYIISPILIIAILIVLISMFKGEPRRGAADDAEEYDDGVYDYDAVIRHAGYDDREDYSAYRQYPEEDIQQLRAAISPSDDDGQYDDPAGEPDDPVSMPEPPVIQPRPIFQTWPQTPPAARTPIRQPVPPPITRPETDWRDELLRDVDFEEDDLKLALVETLADDLDKITLEDLLSEI